MTGCNVANVRRGSVRRKKGWCGRLGAVAGAAPCKMPRVSGRRMMQVDDGRYRAGVGHRTAGARTVLYSGCRLQVAVGRRGVAWRGFCRWSTGQLLARHTLSLLLVGGYYSWPRCRLEVSRLCLAHRFLKRLRSSTCEILPRGGPEKNVGAVRLKHGRGLFHS